MKKYVLSILILTMCSCKKESNTQSETATTEAKPDPYAALYGNWVGEFIADSVSVDEGDYVYSNKINIILKKVDKGTITGYSVVSGNKRPISGKLQEDDYGIHLTLNEPGNQKYDGQFSCTIFSDTLAGKWVANNPKSIVVSRKFKLVKQTFCYNPNRMLPSDGDFIDYYSGRSDTVEEVYDGEVIKFVDMTLRSASDIITKLNASTTRLTENDLKNLKKLELEILRNTIYARHGYTFKKKSFRQFFDPVDWYVPVSDNVDSDLTAVERDNIKLLNRFEQYAEDNYDSFGR